MQAPASAKSRAPAFNEHQTPSSPQDARTSLADLESIVVESPRYSHGSEIFLLQTSVLLTNVSSSLLAIDLKRRKIQLVPGRPFQLGTKVQDEGVVAALVGSKQSSPCNRCSKNDGPWVECFTVRDGDLKPLLDGACAGCHYDGLGAKCSFSGQSILHQS
jgi:hypothetical protein